jgi:hypothetical protein
VEKQGPYVWDGVISFVYDDECIPTVDEMMLNILNCPEIHNDLIEYLKEE